MSTFESSDGVDGAAASAGAPVVAFDEAAAERGGLGDGEAGGFRSTNLLD